MLSVYSVVAERGAAGSADFVAVTPPVLSASLAEVEGVAGAESVVEQAVELHSASPTSISNAAVRIMILLRSKVPCPGAAR